MSGWTRALNQQRDAAAAAAADAASSSAAAASAAALWTSDSDFLGQAASSALATRFETLVQALLADENDLQAQQALIDQLRAGIEPEEEQDATKDSTAAGDELELTPLDRERLTLSSFALALHRLNSFSLLEAQYAQLLDQISFDLCDLLLPALQREWQRVAQSTHAFGSSDGEFDATVAARPLASGILTLLLHLLGEIVARANPREVALTLLAFYERHVHDDDDNEHDLDDDDEDGFDDDDDEKEDVAKQPSSSAHGAASANKLSAFHRLSLSFPLLDLLSTLLRRFSSPPGAAAASSSSSSSGISAGGLLAVSVRHLELYRQLLTTLQRTLQRASQQVAERDEERSVVSESDATTLARLDAERSLWIGLHIKLHTECLDSLQPLLVGPVVAAAPTMDGGATATQNVSLAPPAAPATQLRSIVLSFLFQQLAGFFTLYRAEAYELQLILDDQRAAASASPAAAAPTLAGGPSVSTGTDNFSSSIGTAPVTPGVALLLSLLFRLCACVDRCGVSPSELLSHFRTQRRLEKRMAREEARAWAARGDEDDDDGDEDEDDEEEEEEDGNKHDDEFDSNDEFEENAAVAAFEKANKRTRKPPSALRLLRDELARMPQYNVQGVAHYLATACGYQYFHRIKPARFAAAKASSKAAAPAPHAPPASPATPDPALAALLSSLPDIGAPFIDAAQHVSSRVLLDSIAPYLASLLLNGLQSEGPSSLSQGIALATAIWALLPPASISIPELPQRPAKEEQKSVGADDEESSDDDDDASLENSGAWMLSECMLQCMYLCPPGLPSLRSSLLHLWKDLLSCLGVNTRMRLLQLSVSACAIVSVQAVVLHRIKEEVVAAWNDDSTRSKDAMSSSTEASPERASFLNADLLATLHSYVSQTQMNLLSSLDMLLACLNLFRFCLLREKADAKEGRTSRLDLLRAPVRRVWADKWREVAQEADAHVAQLNEQVTAAAAANAEADADARVEERTQLVLLRNQSMLASELSNLVLQQLDEADGS
jgi:hypothetical protein